MTLAPNDSVHVREAAPGDADAMANLLGQLGYPSSPDDVLRRLERLATEPGHRVLVAEIAGKVVGLAAVFVRHLITVDAPLGRIASLVVDDARRSQGVGNRLVMAAETIAREAGCDRIEVTSAERRTRAHAFYRRLGYEERPHRFVKQLAPRSRSANV